MEQEAASAVATLSTVDATIVIGFLVVVTLVGFAMSKIASQGIDDYFLGGKKIPWWILGISSSTSNFDMAGTMVIISVVFALGYKGLLVELRGGVGMSLAFLMIFLGKWLRRSRVMTSAEWMKIRFGTDDQGKAAHLLSAGAYIIWSVFMIAYFAKGAGKFLTHFLPLGEVSCTAVMVGVGLMYTLMSGLYGVVFTDVLQMILLTFTAIFITFHAFSVTPSIEFPTGFLTLDLENPTSAAAAAMSSADMPIHLFGIAVVMWFFRSALEGMGGVGGYTDQRFFAARTEREASLLTLEAILLSLFRWTMIAGLVVMAYQLVQTGGAGAEAIQQDPEQVLPIVLGHLLPAGVKGLVIAGLVAAAMSTFDSTLNAGASYIVKDIYQSYVNPDADGKTLVRMSHAATIALCVVGILIAAVVEDVGSIWGLITMGITAGMFVPLFLRWYWPRFNGWGFAAGTATGAITALVVNLALGWPLHQAFPTTVGAAFVVAVTVALLTPRVPDELLVDFWLQISPWGLWGRIIGIARERGLVSKESRLKRAVENLSDALSLALSVPFQLCLLLSGMALVFHDFRKLSFFLTVTVICAIGLYFFWYRNLKSEAECQEEDAYYEEKMAAAEEARRAARRKKSA